MGQGSLSAVLHRIVRRIGSGTAGDSDDGQLLAQFSRDRDESAFAQLVQRHGPMVLGVCQRVLNDPHAAEDAFQATFLVLARRAPALDGQCSLGSWLYKVAQNMALKARLEAARRRARERQVEYMPATDPSREALWHELRGILDVELGRLPEKYRAPLVLCYLQGKTNEAAARELGWPLGSIAKRLTRARELLRDRLAVRGVALPAGLLAALLPERGSAAVSAPLAQATTQAAIGFVVGTGAVGTASVAVVHLAEGALRAMFAVKVKCAAVALVLLGLLGTGAGTAWWHGSAEEAVAARAALAAELAATVSDADAQERSEDKPSQALQDRLARSVDLEKGIERGTTLKDGLEFLSDHFDVTLVIDPRAFEVAGIRKLDTVQLLLPRLAGVRLDTILQSLLRQIQGDSPEARGTFIVRKDFIEITAGFQESAFSADGKLLAVAPGAGLQGGIVIRDSVTGREIRQLRLPNTLITSFSFAPDNRTLAASCSIALGNAQQCVVLWDVATGRERHRWKTDTPASQGLAADRRFAFAPDSRTVACEAADGLVFFDTATGDKLRTLPWERSVPQPLGFSASGKTVITTPSAGAVLLEAATGRYVFQFPIQVPDGKGNQDWAAPVAVSRDGKLLVALDRERHHLGLWEVATGQRQAYFQAEGRLGAFSPDARWLATMTQGGYEVNLWDVATGKEVHRFTQLKRPVTTVAFSTDGATLLLGGDDGRTLREDLAALRQKPAPVAPAPTTAELEMLWNALAEENPVKAHDAQLRLAASPEQALPFLQGRLRPTTIEDVRYVPQWIADLDSDRFTIRQRAMAALKRLAELAEPALRRLLAGKPPLEVRSRVEEVLEELKDPPRSMARRQVMRAVEVLEQLGTPALRLLQSLSRVPTKDLLAREAKAALQRVARRAAAIR